MIVLFKFTYCIRCDAIRTCLLPSRITFTSSTQVDALLFTFVTFLIPGHPR